MAFPPINRSYHIMKSSSPTTRETSLYQNVRSANDRKHSDLWKAPMGIRPHEGQRKASRISSYMQT